MRGALCLFFSFCAALATAQASKNFACEHLIKIIKDKTAGGTRPTRFSELGSVTDVALPKETMDYIRAHPIFKKLEKYRNSGTRIKIEAFLYEGEQLNIKDQNIMNVGESVQAHFLQKIADTITGYDPASPPKQEKVVRVTISDRFENDSTVDTPIAKIPQETDFDMTVLKQANPSIGPEQKTLLRLSLGIPQGKKVASFYIHSPEHTKHVRNARGDLGLDRPDIVFLSSGGDSSSDLAFQNAKKHYSMPENGGYQVLKLSEVGPLSFKTFDRVLVVNDTRGQVPYLHAVSDISIVEGPINFFEPISVGTPTYWLPTRNQGSYNLERLAQMQANARRTGLFATSKDESLESFYQRTRQIQLDRGLLVQEADGSRSMDEILSKLAELIP